jgi:bis(5'-nucleosyl)-tetraphosphatase (symmetrical)
MAIYAVGDLQGCYREFRKLLDLVRFDETEEKLWLV